MLRLIQGKTLKGKSYEYIPDQRSLFFGVGIVGIGVLHFFYPEVNFKILNNSKAK